MIRILCPQRHELRDAPNAKLPGEWADAGPFDRDKGKGKVRWMAFFEQRGRSTMAEELHTEIGHAKHAWPNALQAGGDGPTKKPQSEPPISIDIGAIGVGVKKL